MPRLMREINLLFFLSSTFPAINNNWHFNYINKLKEITNRIVWDKSKFIFHFSSLELSKLCLILGHWDKN